MIFTANIQFWIADFAGTLFTITGNIIFKKLNQIAADQTLDFENVLGLPELSVLSWTFHVTTFLKGFNHKAASPADSGAFLRFCFGAGAFPEPRSGGRQATELSSSSAAYVPFS